MSFGACLLRKFIQMHDFVSTCEPPATVFRNCALAGNDAQAINAFENIGKLRCEVRVSLFRRHHLEMWKLETPAQLAFEFFSLIVFFRSCIGTVEDFELEDKS